MTRIGTVKQRQPWLAAVLSLVNTGWGQFYVGNWRRGLVLLAIEFVLGMTLVFMMGHFTWFVLGGLVLIAFNLYVAVDAWLSARRSGTYVLKPCNRWWVYGLLIAFNLVVSTLMKTAPYETYKIPSASMLQTLQVGDHLMAEELTMDDTIRRGDVLIFLYPEDRSKNFVKRVVGLPGETIEMRDRVVFINGERLEESYTFYKTGESVHHTDNFGPMTIPEQEYFMMGDNRQRSHDSRFFGPVERKDILARALYLYMPMGGDWSRFGMEIR